MKLHKCLIALPIERHSYLKWLLEQARQRLDDKGVVHCPPRVDHITLIPPFFCSENLLPRAIHKTQRLGEACRRDAEIRGTGWSFFGRNGQALAVTIEASERLTRTVEDIRGGIGVWVHDKTYLFPHLHATASENEGLRNSVQGLGFDESPLSLNTLFSMRAPQPMLLVKNEIGGWSNVPF